MREFNEIVIPDLGSFGKDSGLQKLDICSAGRFAVGSNGVQTIAATGDGKVEFIAFENKSIAFVRSSMGYPAYYPVEPAGIDKPLKAVLMDLDGTSVRSESFWIWIIQQTTASLLGNPNFELEDEDLPYVSGHSVSEHLKYCVNKYCPDKSVEQAREFYFKHTHEEMELIVQGRGRKDAFTPSPGIKEFLLKLKEANLKIGLVTSGLYEKAWPEILSAFRQLDMPDPKNFYDAIITAGFPLRKGSAGTLGELSPKPHPWLYAEVARVGLGLEPSERRSVIGIEDSGAGVCSIRLAGFAAFGLADGNIIESGTKALCEHYCDNFEEIESLIL
ncbi:HAD family hydrolase [Sedimentisphaera salicampi]|uniref:HAD hydrolase n=1 Tax=Sedimentisphaera salicampi TaxID=1941349 RepID=A0A1W6LJ31_9BACT|nr:HAD family phosphatase [Sedimentisphaera salicampi]ARN55765.1 HAD hydrolase [Sedimentisphaera salicampi]